jgi:hypothetical protein
VKLNPIKKDNGVRFELASGIITWYPDGTFHKESWSGSGKVEIPERVFRATQTRAKEEFANKPGQMSLF